MSMMTSQVLKFVDFENTQKSRYFENKTLFFHQIKKIINYTSRATLLQKNSFVAEVTFNGFNPLTIITKRSILDVAAALDLPLECNLVCEPI